MITEDEAPGDEETAETRPTSERLIAEGLRLFAERGFRATTVGEIEAAAGLQPRRGALYRHFPTKDALLEAAVRRHLEAVRDGRDRFVELPVGDVRSEALALGRFMLDELAAERLIIDILEREGDRIAALRDLFRERVSDGAYLAMAELLRRWSGPHLRPGVDLEATAVLTLGSLVNFYRSTVTLGARPLRIDVERMLSAWSEYIAALVDGLCHRPGP
ncbi:hypothetical protein CFN78_13245 [Amycolatopsis antarctica]|uniref:HTH tetR-type domain-containing protein n=1 Tax=Amycolatopsis antarctica TaxID=1854586 RepID=A0A263D2A6_9PSEU|nr:TetR/AcrR family transcriptional regulator [Amycolatopsis antarctica]OZM72604.1 hypothetical protein CFN78_13245 [Amycolatopsis antarctica]